MGRWGWVDRALLSIEPKPHRPGAGLPPRVCVFIPCRASLTPIASRWKRGWTRGMATKSNLDCRAFSKRSLRSATVVTSHPAVSFSSGMVESGGTGAERGLGLCVYVELLLLTFQREEQ